MAVTFFRTTIVFLTLIVVMRLMGKRQIGEMQPFEFVVTLIIADLACIPMADVSIPLIYGIVSILCLFILHQLFSIFEQKAMPFKKIISGSPSIVINKDGVDVKELNKNSLGLDDLIESMRSSGYFALDDVYYAIFESNGKLSALENTQKAERSNSLSLLIVNLGKISPKNLTIIKKDQKDVKNFLKGLDCPLEKVEIMTVDGNGRVYLKEKNKKYRIEKFNLGEDAKW